MDQLPTVFESASVGQRFAAQAIDSFLVMALLISPQLLPLPYGPLRTLLVWHLIILALGYRLIGDGLVGGAGIGKRLLGIHVVNAATRQPCSLFEAVIRTGIFIFPLVYLIEMVVLVCDGQVRWGDRIAKTFVLRRVPKLAPVAAPLRPADFAAIRESLKRTSKQP